MATIASAPPHPLVHDAFEYDLEHCRQESKANIIITRQPNTFRGAISDLDTDESDQSDEEVVESLKRSVPRVTILITLTMCKDTNHNDTNLSLTY